MCVFVCSQPVLSQPPTPQGALCWLSFPATDHLGGPSEGSWDLSTGGTRRAVVGAAAKPRFLECCFPALPWLRIQGKMRTGQPNSSNRAGRANVGWEVQRVWRPWTITYSRSLLGAVTLMLEVVEMGYCLGVM